ncbi:MAG: glycosyltransferase family 39 protein [Solirubrobacteraceae bacterium]
MSTLAPDAPHPNVVAARSGTPGLDALAIALPTALAAVLCLIAITSRSLGFDEGATVAIASQHGAALGTAIGRDGGNMSGYYLLMHVLIGAFGNGLLVLRLPSALAGTATVGLVAAIGLRLADRRVAVIAGLLTAVSISLVYWAQTARGYAPMVAFVTAGFLAYIVLVESSDGGAAGPGTRRMPWGSWIAYVVLMVLASYSSFVAVLVIPAQLLVLVRRPVAARRLMGALVAVAVCCIPLLILAARRGSGQLFWVPRPSHKVETQVLESLTSAGLQPSFHRTASTYVLLGLTLLALLGIVILVVRRLRRGEAGWAPVMLLAWLIVPVALTFVYSLLAQPLLQPRNLIMCVPALALALGLVLGDRRVPLVAAAAALVVVVGLRAWQLGASYGVSPEPWHVVSADILARARPGDCVAFYPEDARNPFQYYVGASSASVSRAPRSILPVIRSGVVKPYVEDYVVPSRAELMRAGAGCRRLWFISSHEGDPTGPAESKRHRAAYFALDAELEGLFGRAPVQRYGYAPLIHVQLLPHGLR